jgi:hypothetical protein
MEAVLSVLRGIDMLSPLGKLLVNQRHETEDACNKDEALEVPTQGPSEEGNSTPPLAPLLVPYTHDSDLEDAIADEVPRNKSTSEIVIQGEKMTKAKALQQQMAYQASCSSTDHTSSVSNKCLALKWSTIEPPTPTLLQQVTALWAHLPFMWATQWHS